MSAPPGVSSRVEGGFLSTAAEPRVHTIAVGASAGGIEALRELVGALPADFPGVVLVVLHVAPVGTSVLPQILTRAGALEAVHAEDGMKLRGGHIYVAPPDRHLLVAGGYVKLGRGPRVNGHRPAIDPLFTSAAHSYGEGAAGVVLSGVLDDGTAGLMVIKRHGGATFAQDPAEALYAAMPRSAIDFVAPDRVASAHELGVAIGELVQAAPPPPGTAATPAPAIGDRIVEVDRGASDRPQPGVPTGLTCPDCQGGIWESEDDGIVRLRCRVGHEYSAESFMLAQGDRVEMALWTALRTLEERAALHRRMASRLRARGSVGNAARFAQRADQCVEDAIVLRELLGTVHEQGIEDEESVA
jgi:two-component system, chemotaxis family, protein-glutamate methylesterase/glutaminase